jgi:hypothetical protein
VRYSWSYLRNGDECQEESLPVEDGDASRQLPPSTVGKSLAPRVVHDGVRRRGYGFEVPKGLAWEAIAWEKGERESVGDLKFSAAGIFCRFFFRTAERAGNKTSMEGEEGVSSLEKTREERSLERCHVCKA